jgi:hypothetical protein
MSEYYEADVNADGYHEQVDTEYAPGGIGLELTDAVDAYRAEASTEYGYEGDPGYGQEPGEEGETGYEAGTGEYGYETGADTGYTDSGNFYSNDYIDTAVSSNPGGDEGYIALGDGDFVSWG